MAMRGSISFCKENDRLRTKKKIRSYQQLKLLKLKPDDR